MHIGLIGGIGPAATIAYYDRLTRLVRDAGQRLELTIVQADSREVIANVLADRRDEQAAVYATLIARLKAAGADCAAITSLGGSFCFAETERISPLPLVSAVAPLDAYFVGAGLRRVGLLGTEVVMRTRLYGQLVRTEAVAFDGDLWRSARSTWTSRPRCRDGWAAGDLVRGRPVDDRGPGRGRGRPRRHRPQPRVAGHDPGYPVVDALGRPRAVLADLAMDRRTQRTSRRHHTSRPREAVRFSASSGSLGNHHPAAGATPARTTVPSQPGWSRSGSRAPGGRRVSTSCRAASR